MISPLIALMADQVDALKQAGVRAERLDSSMDFTARAEALEAEPAKIRDEFGVEANEAEWVAIGYLLAVAAVVLTSDLIRQLDAADVVPVVVGEPDLGQADAVVDERAKHGVRLGWIDHGRRSRGNPASSAASSTAATIRVPIRADSRNGPLRLTPMTLS